MSQQWPDVSVDAEKAVFFSPSSSYDSAKKFDSVTREDGEAGATDETSPAGVLGRVLSRASSRTSHPSPPPDGGWRAWKTRPASLSSDSRTRGVINSFGTFQTYYTNALHRAPSDISWIGSFQIFLLFFIGTFTGRLTDAGYFRLVVTVGIALLALGAFTTAQGTQYWHFFLSQGVATGLGNGCIFCPCLAVLSTYFSSKRGLAIGLAACGSATGGLVYPSIVRQLLPRLGFPWTMRVIGFIQFATMVAASLGIVPRLPPRRDDKIVEWAAFRELQYTFYAAGTFCCLWGVYVVYFYVASFSRDVIGLSYTASLGLLLVVNGVGIIGRVLPNYIADRYGVLNLFLIVGALCGIIALCWTAVDSQGGLYAWAAVYGIFAGGVQSLFPAGLTSLTTDLSKSGVRMGMVFTINSFATLTGSPIAGAIISSKGGSYTGAQVFTGVTLLVGTCFIFAAKMVLSRQHESGWMAKV
ncbi:major facilitator superfamily transporter monocarboxylate [Grosmannia clavigera kw1407]|uniref:Major facilitator superfamily transporter monocarboxylate n=1 Tax=Grosmannia clavigera (strain kw1407 / UAMH 11150) TaxID=655863 RepID=F0XF89_GROCL|nr:major facilitator superfamily transporter monocarboxylate [Grosmannia clavigera kw1407]EFX03873.1 major facilitator superfamily transporter monocarboxylate [Grosmannia clavigera kw1407]